MTLCCRLRVIPALLLTFFVSHLSVSAQFGNPTVSRSLGEPSITTVALTDYSKLDGNAGTVGHTVTGTVTATVSLGGGAFSHSGSYRVLYQLIDSDGDFVTLQTGPPGTTRPFQVTQEQGVSLSLFGGTSSQTLTFSLAADPTITLDPKEEYLLKATLQQRVQNGQLTTYQNVGPAREGEPQQFFHFTNTATDAALNIQTLARDLTWTGVSALRGNDALKSFTAELDLQVARFDDPGGTRINRSTVVNLDFDLLENSTGRQIPLANDGQISRSFSLQSYFISLPSGELRPHVLAPLEITAEIEPLEQLKSFSELYTLRVNVSHSEGPANVSDLVCQLPAERLLHFNGTLFAGSVATQFESFIEDPVLRGSQFGQGVWVDLSLPVGAGSLPGFPNLSYGDGTPFGVFLRDDGSARFRNGGQLLTTDGSPNTPIEVDFGPTTLRYGAVALGAGSPGPTSLEIVLPQGLTIGTDAQTNAFLGESIFSPVNYNSTLGADLLPTGFVSVSLTGNEFISDESHPLKFKADFLDVTPSGLEFNFTDVEFCHEDSYDTLEQLVSNNQLPASEIDRKSNDRYLRTVSLSSPSGTVTVAADGSARLEAFFQIQEDSYRTHFPYNSQVQWDFQGNQLDLQNGQVSGNLGGPRTVSVAYHTTCPDDDCTSNLPLRSITLQPDSELQIGSGGSISSPGSLVGATRSLRWGVRSPTYAAFSTGDFSRASFHAPGYQLYATETSGNGQSGIVTPDLSPAALLLTTYDSITGTRHFPGSANYQTGDGIIAGLNMDVETNGVQGISRIAGETYSYDLLSSFGNGGHGGSKYYIRPGGVSGRQIAVTSSAQQTVDIYGFPVDFDSYQLSFLDNDNSRAGCSSWANGSVSISGFSNWSQDFTSLQFDCFGEPGAMTPAGPRTDKSLTYWNSSFDLAQISFAGRQTSPDGVCPKTFSADLVVGAKLEVSNVPNPIIGSLAFKRNGNLSTTSNPIAGIDSRLGIPTSLVIKGPEAIEKDYTLVTSTKLRFNNPESLIPEASEPGFVTFAGTVDVPFFDDLPVQAITSAAPGQADLFLTPGWTQNGNSFFSKENFDPDHRSFPASVQLSDYRSPNKDSADSLKLKAKQSLFGLVPLSYAIKWDPLLRTFKSFTPNKQELLITTMEHEVEHLDPMFANISFGAEYDGIPQLKLSNFLNNQIDGAAGAISRAVSGESKKAVDAALSEFDRILEDTAEALVDPVVESFSDPVESIHTDLVHLLAIAENTNGDYQTFRNSVRDRLNVASGSAFLGDIKSQLEELRSANGNALSFIADIQSALETSVIGIDAIANGIDVDPNDKPLFREQFNPGAQFSDFRPGFLLEEDDDNGNPERKVIRNIVNQLLDELLEPQIASLLKPLIEAGSGAISEQYKETLEEIDPTLDQIQSALREVRKVLIEIRSGLIQAQGVGQKIDEVITRALDTTGEAEQIAQKLSDAAWAHFVSLEQSLGIPAAETELDRAGALIRDFDLPEFKNVMKGALKNALLESEIVAETKYLLRQALFDVRERFNSAVQNVLAQVSEAMKSLVKETVGALEEKLNPLLGKVSEYMGSGELTGFAETNGDALRKLRLDAKMELKVPKELSLHVFLEIFQYTSEDNFVQSGCILPGEKAVEVKIGAEDVVVDWIAEIRARFGVKLTLKQEQGDAFPKPNGVSGYFELKDGEIDFQTITLVGFGATVAVGSDEAYLGAKARAKFSNYEMAGGLFFGRTCTLEPLLFVDPDIGDVVTAGTTFTGAYVYGEVWLPISEIVLGVPASCMFRISAGVGAGAFYFVEGPTYGGKMLLGVSGEALCMVSIKGTIKMILASQAGSLRGAGTGRFTAAVGACDWFCLEFDKSVKVKYDNGDWSLD